MIFPTVQPRNTPTIPLENCLAKTIKLGDSIHEGSNVYVHLWITYQVICYLRQLWKETPREKLLPLETDVLCAFHDIGKISPGFQQKIYFALNKPLDLGANFLQASDHAAISRATLLPYGEYLANLAGMHHGINLPDKSLCDSDECCGGKNWADMRKALIIRLHNDLKLPERYTEIPEAIQPVILGATILSDWLSSSMELSLGKQPSIAEIRNTVDRAGFKPLNVRPHLTFQDIFHDITGQGYTPNNLQRLCSEHICPGGIYVIESGMGSGKTEAALYLAYRLLEEHKANGIYFALPTRLTSEKIHDRLNTFLSKILPSDSNYQSMLIHGDAWINWQLQQIEDDDMATGNNCDSWFQSKKRALLATFGAGTIDQALLAVVNAKHRALRALALSGKVVIIDEIHSYDSYTGSLVKTLVQNLHNWGCTVIILSATLTSGARNSFIHLTNFTSESIEFSEHYPLVTIKNEKTVVSYPISDNNNKTVALSLVSVEDEALSKAYSRALTGEQVLWIENTIEKAQATYSRFNQMHDTRIELGLIHSAFSKKARIENEDYWTRIYGKNGQTERKSMGRILVGTQVLEQSIDIDADFLITRLAPMDMLYQRIGRLWRHPFMPRPHTATCQAIVLYDSFMEDTETFRKKYRELLPYEAYVLYRTLELLKSKDILHLSNDIRHDLEVIYAPREEFNPMLEYLKKNMEEKIAVMERKANIAMGVGLEMDDDDNAQTRLNDESSVQVLLLCKNKGNPQITGQIFTPFMQEPISIRCENSMNRIKAISQIQQCLLTVRESLAPKYSDFETDFLKDILWTGKGDNRPVRAAYLDSDGQLLDQASNPLKFKYLKHLGYFKIKE